MTHIASTTTVDRPPATAQTRPTRRRFARTGFLSGLVGGVCCLGSALAVATGLGALSFFQVWMDRYQAYFIVASLTLMTVAAFWIVRRHGLQHARRMLVRHAAVMVAVYVATFGVAATVYGFVAR